MCRKTKKSQKNPFCRSNGPLELSERITGWSAGNLLSKESNPKNKVFKLTLSCMKSGSCDPAEGTHNFFLFLPHPLQPSQQQNSNIKTHFYVLLFEAPSAWTVLVSRKRAGIHLAFRLIASWSCGMGEHPEHTSIISCDPTSPIQL